MNKTSKTLEKQQKQQNEYTTRKHNKIIKKKTTLITQIKQHKNTRRTQT